MFGDWQIWRKTLAQSVVVLAVVAVVALGSRQYAPAIARTLTGTPEPLLAVCESLEVEPARALVTGWVERAGDGSDSSEESPGTEQSQATAGQESQSLDPWLHDIATRAMSILAGPDLAYGPELGDVTGPGVVEYILRTADCLYRTCSRRIGEGAGLKVYLVCSAEIREPAVLAERQRRLESALNSLGSGARRLEPVYTTVFAQLPGILDDAQCREAAQRVMARLHGRRLHEFDGNALYSLLSFSILLGPTVEVAGRQVNLSVVLRPDTETGSTWVVIGTPLCAGDY